MDHVMVSMAITSKNATLFAIIFNKKKTKKNRFRYANGAGTNPDAHVLAFAGAQLKKNLDVAKKLNSENFVFWGGREGYQSLLNTDVKGELTHMAQLFKMVVGK